MHDLDIVYIKGNPMSGTPFLHEQIDNTIIGLINQYSYLILDSEQKNLSGIKLPKAKVYIGFSRGSRYLNKLDNFSLKISIGGVSGSRIHLFKNENDHILLGDISNESMEAHFLISENDKIKIKKLLTKTLNI